MAPGPHVTCWDDLPVEIIEYIALYLDPPSLLSFGKVNRISNRVALTRLLGRRAANDILSSSSVSIPRFSPIELMPAISAALWLPPISHIDYSPIRHDIGTFMDDIHCLIRLISPSPPDSLETLRLRFLLFDRKEVNRCLKELRRPSISLKTWLRLMSGLVDTALSKGCKTLDIGGSLFPYLRIPGSSPGLIARVCHMVQTASRFLHHPGAASMAQSFKLESLTIGICELLSPPFLSYTLGILRKSAHTLQHLEFCFSWPAITARSWANLFGSLSLPSLKTLVITGGSYFPLSPRVLRAFLSRHPSIIHLELKFTFINADSTPIGLRRPILPNLQTLQAWPHVVVWLLSSPPSTRRHERDNIWYPSLESVTILPNIRLSTSKDLLAVTQAILSLNHVLPIHSGTKAPRPLPHMTLRMSLFQTCWIRWIEENAENQVVNLPLPALLGRDLSDSKIQRMTLALDHSIHPDFLQNPGLPSSIARWLSLFSSLEELEIVPCPFTDTTKNEQLRHEIMQRCTSLKMLKLTISDQISPMLL
ncbi:hypothetical protein AN958_03003 [Leucoagaricus sp. SymC.cos]|nr:hypothetical protein AN958_03003 [Leucoagaricus sp. SymC.cos]